MKIILDKLSIATPIISREIDEFRLKQIGRKVEKMLLKDYSLLCEVRVEE